MDLISNLIEQLDARKLKPTINLDRPKYVQPEDLISYRSARIVVILGMLTTKNGLSKETIACVDFLLRNPGYQKTFIIEYFKNQRNLADKLRSSHESRTLEFDFNIIRYKSVPWDLRFNDMFLFLFVRKLISFTGSRENLRAMLSETAQPYFLELKNIFIHEVNFLEIFGSVIQESKAIRIITEVIPDTFWKENEKLNY